MAFEQLIVDELNSAARLLEQYLSDPSNISSINAAAEKLGQCINNGGKIISCGNGGSHCDAMHFAEELSGKFRDNRRSLPAISISDSSHITCTANDFGYNEIFSRFIEGLGNQGDALVAITTSGNSENVIRAAEVAREKGMIVIGLTGKDGGKLGPLCDVELRVPHQGYADRIQEMHIKLIHILILLIEKIVT